MKIIGLGIDIVDNLRIKKLIKNKAFLTRVFTKKEISTSKKFRSKYSDDAKRFAAK